jgi:hypothetical protein
LVGIRGAEATRQQPKSQGKKAKGSSHMAYRWIRFRRICVQLKGLILKKT